MNARQMVEAAMELIGILGDYDTPSNAGASKALGVLNRMFANWYSSDLMQPKKIMTFTLTPNVGEYTLGEEIAGKTSLSSDKVSSFQDARIDYAGNSYNLAIRSINDYFNLSDKSVCARPEGLFYESGRLTGRLFFYPIPDIAYTLVVQALEKYTDLELNDEIPYPEDYYEVIEWNLAVKLAPRYGVQLDPVVVGQAERLMQERELKNTYPLPDAEFENVFNPCGAGGNTGIESV